MPSLPPAIELVVHRTGEGPPLIALHDLGQTGQSMIDALAPVADEYRIVAPDLRGHGESPTPHGPWSIDDFASWAAEQGLPIVGIDNLDGAVPLDSVVLPERCVLLFGQEGPGLSAAAREAVELVCSIRQFGSTRSINAGVASGIAMYEWIRRYADLNESDRGTSADTPNT